MPSKMLKLIHRRVAGGHQTQSWFHLPHGQSPIITAEKIPGLAVRQNTPTTVCQRVCAERQEPWYKVGRGTGKYRVLGNREMVGITASPSDPTISGIALLIVMPTSSSTGGRCQLKNQIFDERG